jgi:DNA replication and repair protein RecF
MGYDSPLVAPDAVGGSESSRREAIAQAFHQGLAAVAPEEARRGVTLVGPHRDDVSLAMDGHDLRRFGSQGQRRLLAVLLRLAELSHLEDELREPCVLLLDDVFAEFDDAISDRLHQLLDGTRQAFVTSPGPVRTPTPSQATRYEVAAGRVCAAPRSGGC